MEPAIFCPECEVGKHGNCDSFAWDEDEDREVACSCWVDGHFNAFPS